MDQDDELKTLIRELIDKIQGTFQESPEILAILHQIEQEGYTLNLSLLVGIFVKDKDGVDRYFSSIPDSDADIVGLYRQLFEKAKNAADLPEKGDWTDTDRDFLGSIGIDFKVPQTDDSGD
ncbi:hypothetical protein JXQ70_10015 [bacterium]|nr:hypothetical protein [bacterium]